MPARWTAYLAKHNALVAFVAQVATAADAQGIFWAIENPASRRGGWAWWPEQADAPSLWDMPEIVELRRATKAARRTFAQCQFGSEYQKYTSVMVAARGEAELIETEPGGVPRVAGSGRMGYVGSSAWRRRPLPGPALLCQPCGGHPLLMRKSSVSYPSVCCVNAWYGARSAA